MEKGKIIGSMVAIGSLAVGGYGLFKGMSNREPKKYSIVWIKNLSNKDWSTEREIVRKKFCSPQYSDNEREHFKKILDLFDKIKSEKDWAGRKPHGPAIHREHGWYL